jgi:subtilisin family serine protease
MILRPAAIGGLSVPRRVVLRMALGEAPDTIPASSDVRRGGAAPATRFDGGPVDRMIRHFAGAARISGVYPAAAALGQSRPKGIAFNDREHVFGLARTFRFDLPPGARVAPLIDSLSQLTTVEAATPDHLCTTPFAGPAATTPVAYDPWKMVHAAEALAYEPGDPAIIVGIVDSGVVPEHPELPRLRAGYDTVQIGVGDFAQGFELLGDDSRVDTDPRDRYVGHGMACAGIIGARGLAMSRGLAGDCQLLPVRGLGAVRVPGTLQVFGIGAATDLDMAVKVAVDLGARVLNMSFGTDDSALDPQLPKPHADVVAYALDRGCVLVAASGNSGTETRYWPAAYPGVIATGAVGADSLPTSFSTRGSHVALCAPGERVRSLGLTGYQQVNGTSFAAPFVAATAALMVAHANHRSMAVSSQDVRNLLCGSATPFPGPPISGCGSGVLDAAAALRALDAWIDQTVPDTRGDVEDDD